MATKGYLTNPDVLGDPNAIAPRAAYMLRLMTAYDVLRSGRLWVTREKDSANPAENTEQLVGILAIAGWMWEMRNVLITGASRNPPVVTKRMCQGNQELEKTWKDLNLSREKEGEKELLTPEWHTVKRIRNKHVFHFDKTGTSRAMRYILKKGVNEFPFVETGSSHAKAQTRYPWAYVALGASFSNAAIDDANLKRGIEHVNSLIDSFLKLLDKILQEFWREMGLNLREESKPEESQETEPRP